MLIDFSFNFLDNIISIIRTSVCGCLCQWSVWLGNTRELNLVFPPNQLACIFLLMCWNHKLKLLRKLFQLLGLCWFCFCYSDPGFFFSFLQLVSQTNLVRHYSFLHSSAFFRPFPEFHSFLWSCDWDVLSGQTLSLSACPRVLCGGRDKQHSVLLFQCSLFLSIFKGSFPTYSNLHWQLFTFGA